MELRRALLLFAIVLGLAAIASSIAREPDDARRDRSAAGAPAAQAAGDDASAGTADARAGATDARAGTTGARAGTTDARAGTTGARAGATDARAGTADVPAGADDGAATVRFSQRHAPQSLRVSVGAAATVIVKVAVAGQVRMPSLGLTAPAEPLTPARFDLLLERPSRHAIELDPADSARPTVAVGTLRAAEGS